LLFSDQIIAQKNTGIIKGKIIGADGNPGINVNVALKKSGKEIVTNNDGFFMFQHLPTMMDTLVISSVESKLLSQIVTVSANETVDVGTIEIEI
jgi:hypothetical protein